MDAFAVVVVADSLGTSQKRTTDVAAACDTGRYGVMVGSFKLCALCASGTAGDDGYGCTTCDSGTASAVGAASCSDCQAGSYAQGGEWRVRADSAAPGTDFLSACGLLGAGLPTGFPHPPNPCRLPCDCRQL